MSAAQPYLVDEAARAWLEAAGYASVELIALHLSGNQMTSGNFDVARVWHTRTSFTRRVSSGVTRIRFQVEGVTSILDVNDDTHLRIAEGEVVCLPPGTYRFDSDTSTNAFYEIGAVFPFSHSDGKGAKVRDAGASPYVEIFMAAVNAAFDAREGLEGDQFPHLRTALASLAWAITPPMGGRHVRSEKLVTEAIALIHQRYEDPHFTVARLASELHISERYLQNLLRRAGTSASAELRAARVRHAIDIRARTPSLSLVDVASRSGFSSVRTLKAAFASSERGGLRPPRGVRP